MQYARRRDGAGAYRLEICDLGLGRHCLRVLEWMGNTSQNEGFDAANSRVL